MSDNFQKTVNLKDKSAVSTARPVVSLPPRQEPMARASEASEKKKSEAMDRIFGEEKNDLQKINRVTRRAQPEFLKYLWPVIAVLAVIALLVFVFRSGKKEEVKIMTEPVAEQWYSVKLVNGETYYGEIGDLKADPVVIKNVYYDYDLLNKKEPESGEKATATGLRLVKRGKESYGPDGTMNVVRGQILLFEQLKDDSKVLKAILENERK